MELVVSLILGVWIAVSGVICYVHYSSSRKGGEK